jgi:hypothetical protein
MPFFTSQPAEARLKVVSAFFEKFFTQFAWIDNIPGTPNSIFCKSLSMLFVVRTIYKCINSARQ